MERIIDPLLNKYKASDITMFNNFNRSASERIIDPLLNKYKASDITKFNKYMAVKEIANFWL